MPKGSYNVEKPGGSYEIRRGTAFFVGLVVVIAAMGVGWVLGTRGDFSGFFSRLLGSSTGASSEEGSEPSSQEADNLKAIPYLQGYRPAREESSVTVFDRERAAPGLNLYVSGHGEEAILMDMKGSVRHRWRYPLRRAFPDLDAAIDVSNLQFWRRALLYPNGDLLAIYETLGLVRLDRNSKLQWIYRSDAHHDFFVDPDEKIWVLDRRGRLMPRMHLEKGVLEDLITVLDPQTGLAIRQFSILEAFEQSAYRALVADRPVRHGDIFHTNTLDRLDGSLAELHPAFREGNLLVSVNQLNTVAVIDAETETVVWALGGLWRNQHQPVLLPGGTLMVFDNRSAPGQHSRVLEIDPFSQELLWSYGGRPGETLFSETLGTCQRLANGNTLITESENGRALEVTPGGEIVWEFHNPHRSGQQDELVATLFEVVRLPPDFPFQGDSSRFP